jgi:hypothetical protein
VNLLVEKTAQAHSVQTKSPVLRSVDGRLPYKILPRLSGGPGNDETCDACGETITKKQMVMEEIGTGQNALHFHVRCFNVWDELCRSAST